MAQKRWRHRRLCRAPNAAAGRPEARSLPPASRRATHNLQTSPERVRDPKPGTAKRAERLTSLRHVVLLGAGRAGRLEASLAEGGHAGALVGGEAQPAVDTRRVLIHPVHAAELAQRFLAAAVEPELVASLASSPSGVGRGGWCRQRVEHVHAPATLCEHDGGQNSGGAGAHHSSFPGLASLSCSWRSGQAAPCRESTRGNTRHVQCEGVQTGCEQSESCAQPKPEHDGVLRLLNRLLPCARSQLALSVAVLMTVRTIPHRRVDRPLLTSRTEKVPAIICDSPSSAAAPAPSCPHCECLIARFGHQTLAAPSPFACCVSRSRRFCCPQQPCLPALEDPCALSRRAPPSQRRATLLFAPSRAAVCSRRRSSRHLKQQASALRHAARR